MAPSALEMLGGGSRSKVGGGATGGGSADQGGAGGLEAPGGQAGGGHTHDWLVAHGHTHWPVSHGDIYSWPVGHRHAAGRLAAGGAAGVAHGGLGLGWRREEGGDVCSLPPRAAFIPGPWASRPHRPSC